MLDGGMRSHQHMCMVLEALFLYSHKSYCASEKLGFYIISRSPIMVYVAKSMENVSAWRATSMQNCCKL